MSGTIGSRPTARIVSVLLLMIPPTISLAEKSPGFQWNVETQLRYDDNVHRTIDRSAESDTTFVVKPKLSWVSLYGKHLFDLSYQGGYNFIYYSDHHLKAHALLDHSYRLNSEYTLGAYWGHDRPGNTDALNPTDDRNQWRDSYAKGKIYYGHSDSQGQLLGQLDYHQKRYTNNDQEYRNHNRLGTTGTFYYRVAPKTRMLFEISFTDYDYRNDDTFRKNQSNQEFRYLTGVTWEVTTKTAGIFKIGYQDKNYDDSTFGDLSSLALMLDSTWRPNTYTTVTFGAAQKNQESSQESTNGYVRRHVRGGLEHDITPRTRLLVKIWYGNDQFDAFDREDNRWDVRLGVKHSLLRWLYVGAEYQYEDRDSSLDIYDFRANVFMLTVGTSFDN